MSGGEERVDPPFDADRLTDCEREVWEEYCSRPSPNEGIVFRVWSFGHICMLECSGVPKVVGEYLEREDPQNKVGRYLENVRAARRRREGGAR